MRPQLRCSVDPAACIASRSVALVDGEGVTSEPCPVCGRQLRVRGRYDVRSGQIYVRLPNHRRADRPADRLTRKQTERLLVSAALKERKARAAIAKKARNARQLVDQAIAAVEQLPRTSTRDRRLVVLHKRAAKVAVWSAPKPPRGADKAVKELLEAGEVDPSFIDPGETDWLEHIGTVLDARTVRRVGKVRPTRRIYAGLVELMKRARPRTWRELETGHFAGQLSFLAFVRSFRGLEGLRLPAAAVDAMSDQYTGEAPF